MDFILAMPTPLLFVVGVLGTLFIAFLIFIFRGGWYWWRLHGLQKKIHIFEKTSAAEEFKKLFSIDPKLAHLWKEYQALTYFKRDERDGQMVVSSIRASVPAETYFNNQYVVDSWLYTELFKHFPGLFTGLGIIGTFIGLILGLQKFQVSEDAATVRTGLESLMHSVGEAFYISGAAILMAMVATFLEKLVLAALYKKTEEIAHAIDAKFDSGAGEEYLSRIVAASEDSASQAKILKDALVSELGELLRELTSAQIKASQDQQINLADRMAEASRQQVEAARYDSQTLATTIAESIQQSLQGPLQDIAKSVQTASGDQSAGAVRMLQDVMVSFSQRLNDLFGGQIAGLSDLNQQTALSIQNAVGTLQALVANMEDSSRRSTDAMAERMAAAIEKMEARQEAMNAQSHAFVEQIRELVTASQSETTIKLQTTVESIGKEVAAMLATLNQSQKQVFEENREREGTMLARTSDVVGAMSSSVDAAIKEIGAASAQMAQNVATMTQVNTTAINKMNAGAEQLNVASGNFATAGQKVSNVLTQTAEVAANLADAASAVRTGAVSINELLRDYRAQRDAVGELLAEVRVTVEGARKEASLTADILARIQGAAERLGVAQKQADEYLDGVSRVLGDAHNAFAAEIKKTLDTSNHAFHGKLSTAVSMLSAAISEFELTLTTAGLQPLDKNRRKA